MTDEARAEDKPTEDGGQPKPPTTGDPPAQPKLLAPEYLQEHEQHAREGKMVANQVAQLQRERLALEQQQQLLRDQKDAATRASSEALAQKDVAEREKAEAIRQRELLQKERDGIDLAIRRLEEQREKLQTEKDVLQQDRDAFKRDSEYKEQKLQARINEHLRHHAFMSKLFDEIAISLGKDPKEFFKRE